MYFCIWDNSKSDIFVHNLQQKQDFITDLCIKLERDGVDKSVQDFTSFLQKEASTVMTKKKNKNKINVKKKRGILHKKKT